MTFTISKAPEGGVYLVLHTMGNPTMWFDSPESALVIVSNILNGEPS